MCVSDASHFQLVLIERVMSSIFYSSLCILRVVYACSRHLTRDANNITTVGRHEDAPMVVLNVLVSAGADRALVTKTH